MSEIGLGNLYDYNKNRINLVSALSKSKIEEAKTKIKIYMCNKQNKYYMLLCREKNDYTIFKTNNKPEGHLYNISVALDEIIPSRGAAIKEIEYDKTSDAYEIWVSTENESFMYLFFPCDNFVIDELGCCGGCNNDKNS